jgi:hypothetical protein
MEPPEYRLANPDPKASELFHQFAQPLLESLSLNERRRVVESSLMLAQVIWNAVIKADLLGDQSSIENARSSFRSPGIPEVVESMIARKRDLFSEHQMMIGGWVVWTGHDGFHLEAESRDPHKVSGA